MAATIKIPTVFTAVDKFSSVVKNMAKGVGSFGKTGIANINRFDRRVTSSFKKMSSLSQLAFGAGTGALILNSVDTIRNYEQSLADLSAVMNTSAENQLKLAKDAERLGASTAKSATEVVGLQEAFARLGFPTDDIINMTGATISGSIAMNAELAETAELTGAMIKTFDSFSSIDAPNVLDKMTLATQKSALNFTKLQTGLPIVAGAANSAGIGFDRLLALMGKLSDAGIDASSSSTALRNIFLDSAKAGLSYEQILAKISSEADKLTPAMDQFGKRGAVSAAILSNKLSETSELTKVLASDFKGAAEAAADTRLKTLSGSLTLLKSAWEGLLLSTNENTGAMSVLKSIIDFVTKNIDKLALGVVSLVGLFGLMKVVVWGSRAAMVAYNIALGVTGVIQGGLTRKIATSTIALGAYKVAQVAGTVVTWLATAATTAFGVAMAVATSPITLIVLAVAAAILIFKNWGVITDWFGEKFGMFTDWIGEKWTQVIAYFQNFSFKQFFMDIASFMFSGLLLPLKSLLFLASKLPGKLGGLASEGLEKLGALTDFSGDVSVKSDGLPSTSQASNKITQETINTNKNKLDINLNDPGGQVSDISGDSNDINIISTSTFAL